MMLFSLLSALPALLFALAQFFALADIFMSSPLVPAYTMASFAKRMARLALATPPAGAMIAIAFVHNLLR